MTLTCDLTCDQSVTTKPDVSATHSQPTIAPRRITRQVRHIAGVGLIAEITDGDGQHKAAKRYAYASPGEQIVAYVTERLEQAGRTVLALPRTGYTTGIKGGSPDFVRQVAESYGWDAEPIRPSHPTNRAISDMDEAYAWLRFIPDSHMLNRRIVGIRSLVHPLTDRHLYPWRRLGNVLNIHHQRVQQLHEAGIAEIICGLHQIKFFK